MQIIIFSVHAQELEDHLSDVKCVTKTVEDGTEYTLETNPSLIENKGKEVVFCKMQHQVIAYLQIRSSKVGVKGTWLFVNGQQKHECQFEVKETISSNEERWEHYNKVPLLMYGLSDSGVLLPEDELFRVLFQVRDELDRAVPFRCNDFTS